MSLDKWVEYGWLRHEASTPNEIQGLLGIVKRCLNDCKVTSISADLRFTAAFNAALAAASSALRAAGYRIPAQPGHHLRTIDSLEYTVQASSKIIQRLKTFSNKRNQSIYDVAGVISDQDLTEMMKIATELQSQITSWLEKTHPELLK